MHDTNRAGGAGGASLLAALIVAAALLAAGLMVRDGLRATQQELAALRSTISGDDAPPAEARRREARRLADDDRREVAPGDAPAIGPADAPITVVEFSDLYCPYCKRVQGTLASIREKYGSDVRLVFKHFPLPIHQGAEQAHRAAAAAGRQGKFFEMAQRLFDAPHASGREAYAAHALALGLDVERFKRDFDSPELAAEVDADVAQGRSIGVSGTPSFFINGRFLSGAQPLAAFERVIDQELEAARG
jgi:protein-disulfide isomerase